MAALPRSVESVSSGPNKADRQVSKARVTKEAGKAQATARRPNQGVGSFDDLSVQDREALADLLERELARI